MLNEKLKFPELISFLLTISAMLSNDMQHMHYQSDKLVSSTMYKEIHVLIEEL
jgi:hypothetical protein